jgi:rubrerythrin
LKAILNLLADAEVKHFKVLQQLKDNDSGARMDEDAVFESSKNIFTEMQSSGDVEGITGGEAALYRKAYEIETKSYDFYNEKARELNDEAAAILRKIAVEEKRHMVLMENLAEMVDRPQSWLEDAEWNHWDEY